MLQSNTWLNSRSNINTPGQSNLTYKLYINKRLNGHYLCHKPYHLGADHLVLSHLLALQPLSIPTHKPKMSHCCFICLKCEEETVNLRNQMEKRMEKIKPETSLKCSMNGEKSVCIHILFKEFLRLMESFFSPPTPPKKQPLENTTNVIFFSEHKNFFLKSCL